MLFNMFLYVLYVLLGMISMNLLSNLWDNRGFVIVIGVIFVVQIILTEIGGTMGQMLRTVPLAANEYIIVIALSSLIIPFDLMRKFAVRRCDRMKPARKARH